MSWNLDSEAQRAAISILLVDEHQRLLYKEAPVYENELFHKPLRHNRESHQMVCHQLWDRLLDVVETGFEECDAGLRARHLKLMGNKRPPLRDVSLVRLPIGKNATAQQEAATAELNWARHLQFCDYKGAWKMLKPNLHVYRDLLLRIKFHGSIVLRLKEEEAESLDTVTQSRPFSGMSNVSTCSLSSSKLPSDSIASSVIEETTMELEKMHRERDIDLSMMKDPVMLESTAVNGDSVSAKSPEELIDNDALKETSEELKSMQMHNFEPADSVDIVEATGTIFDNNCPPKQPSIVTEAHIENSSINLIGENSSNNEQLAQESEKAVSALVVPTERETDSTTSYEDQKKLIRCFDPLAAKTEDKLPQSLPASPIDQPVQHTIVVNDDSQPLVDVSDNVPMDTEGDVHESLSHESTTVQTSAELEVSYSQSADLVQDMDALHLETSKLSSEALQNSSNKNESVENVQLTNLPASAPVVAETNVANLKNALPAFTFSTVFQPSPFSPMTPPSSSPVPDVLPAERPSIPGPIQRPTSLPKRNEDLYRGMCKIPCPPVIRNFTDYMNISSDRMKHWDQSIFDRQTSFESLRDRKWIGRDEENRQAFSITRLPADKNEQFNDLEERLLDLGPSKILFIVRSRGDWESEMTNCERVACFLRAVSFPAETVDLFESDTVNSEITGRFKHSKASILVVPQSYSDIQDAFYRAKTGVAEWIQSAEHLVFWGWPLITGSRVTDSLLSFLFGLLIHGKFKTTHPTIDLMYSPDEDGRMLQRGDVPSIMMNVLRLIEMKHFIDEIKM